jgi:hypothetical protein
MGDQSRGEGEGFWAGLALGYSLLLDAKQIRQGEGIFRIPGLQREIPSRSFPSLGRFAKEIRKKERYGKG